MRLRFKGDGATDGEGHPAPCTVFGVTFPAGEWLDAPPLSAAQFAKLTGNPAFEHEGAAPVLKDNGPKAEADIPANWAELPFLKQKALANDVGADLPKKAKKAEVQAAIQAEVDRRAAVAKAILDGEDDDGD